MSAIKRMEAILDELLANASEIQETEQNSLFSAALLKYQSQLLDALFEEWSQSSEEEKREALETELERKTHLFATKNRSSLQQTTLSQPPLHPGVNLF